MAPKKKQSKNAPVKKVAAKKQTTHKDTKSHNVNIRVVSGVKKGTLPAGLPKDWINDRILTTEREIAGLEQIISSNLLKSKSNFFNYSNRQAFKAAAKNGKEMLKELKTHLKELYKYYNKQTNHK